MPANELNLTIEQGATFENLLTFKDASQAVIDVTSWDIAGQIRRTWDSPTIIETFTFTKANQITNTGEVTMSLTDAETSAILALERTTEFVYDVEATVSGKKYRVMQGIVFLRAEVTR